MPLGQITISIEDAKRQQGQTRVYINPAESVESDLYWLREYAQEIARRLDDLLAGQIVGITVSLDIPLPAGLKPSAELSSDLQEGANFVYQANNRFLFKHRLPTFRELYLNGKQIDLGALAVSDFIDIITRAEELPGNFPFKATERRGSSLGGFIRAYESWGRK